MIEQYKLDGDTYPLLPCPHDCEIKEVKYDDSFLTIVFEDDISQHDSIQHIRPQSVSLIIRYHLLFPDLSTYRSIRHITRFGKRFGKFGYYLVDNHELKKTKTHAVRYIGQRIDYKSILIELELFRRNCESILIDAAVDYVEYEWIDK